MSFLLGKSSRYDSDSIPLLKKLCSFRVSPKHTMILMLLFDGKRFSILVRLAKRYLCVPATSVPAERIFSTVGLVISNQRSSLTPENADILEQNL